MCGIVGAVGGRADRRSAGVDAGIVALAHRGPDGHGRFDAEGVTLGHTRLAIIDPTNASDQPMIDPATGVALVYNGEIYNYIELRAELVSRGHTFSSAGDTEVLLRCYLEYGEAFVSHLNGMFALAIWDTRSSTLLLARDRLGEKPLHLVQRGDEVWFASEAKALLAAGAVQARAATDVVAGFLMLGDVVSPGRSFFADITQLPPGHCARVAPGRGLDAWRYWSPAGMQGDDLGEPDIDEQFQELFEDSVRLRLRSDVPLGTSLSGGVDSAAVVTALRHHRPDGDLHAFTASFPGDPSDELDDATALADELGLSIHAVPLVAADLVTDLVPVIRANEAPPTSASVLAQYRVMQAAHQAGVTVLLDGQGSDETWLGYTKYVDSHLLDLVARGRLKEAWRFARDRRALTGEIPRPPLGRYAGLIAPRRVRMAAVAAMVRVRRPWLAEEFRRAHPSIDPLPSLAGAASRPGRVATDFGLVDLEHVLLPRLLHYADRNSMAWAREVRLPFLDHRLVELAMRTSVERRTLDGWGKAPVRAYLRRRGVTAPADRIRKVAFAPPHDLWMAAPEVAALARDAWSTLHGAGVLAAPVAPDAPALLRWRVLALATWAEQYSVTLS